MTSDQVRPAPREPQHADDSPPSVEQTLLGQLVGYALRRAQLANFRQVNAAIGELGIRPAQFSVLVMAEAYPGITQSELAQCLNVDPPRMVNLLHNLEEHGLALRVRNKVDRRSHGIFLTKRGEAELQSLKARVHEAEDTHLGELSSQERDTLLQLLQRLF